LSGIWFVAAIPGAYYAVAPLWLVHRVGDRTGACAKGSRQKIAPREGAPETVSGDRMTSESDSTPRRRPPTIDLTATEVAIERSAPEPGHEEGTAQQNAAQKEPDGRAGWEILRGLQPHALGAALGAVVMAAVLVGLWLTGVAPTHNHSPAGTGSAANGISAKLDAIQAELQAQSPFASRLTAVEAQAKVLSDALAELNRRLDDVAAAAKASVQRGDIGALSGRIGSLEDGLKTLSERVASRPASANDRAARAAVAAEALRAVVERGASYQAELAAVKSLGADQTAVTPLEPFATDGLPSAAELARELSQLTPALLQASGTASSGGSLIERLERSAKSLVRVTPIEAPPSNEPSAVVARLNLDVERADIADAVAQIGRLPQSAQALAEPWVQKVNARNAAIAASRRIAADALAVLSTANTQ
jgi:hypothetical protein